MRMMIDDGRHDGPLAVLKKFAQICLKRLAEIKAETMVFDLLPAMLVGKQRDMFIYDLVPKTLNMTYDAQLSNGGNSVIGYGEEGLTCNVCIADATCSRHGPTAGYGGPCACLVKACLATNAPYAQLVQPEMGKERHVAQYSGVPARAPPALHELRVSKTLRVPLTGRRARGSGKPPSVGRYKGVLELGPPSKRAGRAQRCSNCGETGHKMTTCPNPAGPPGVAGGGGGGGAAPAGV